MIGQIIHGSGQRMKGKNPSDIIFPKRFKNSLMFFKTKVFHNLNGFLSIIIQSITRKGQRLYPTPDKGKSKKRKEVRSVFRVLSKFLDHKCKSGFNACVIPIKNNFQKRKSLKALT